MWAFINGKDLCTLEGRRGLGEFEIYLNGERETRAIAAFEGGLALVYKKGEKGSLVYDFVSKGPKVFEFRGKVELRRVGQ